MKPKSHTRQDYLICLWLVLVSLCLLQGSLMHVKRDWAMGVLEDRLSVLRGQHKASEAIIWHIHGPQAAVEEDFEAITVDGD